MQKQFDAQYVDGELGRIGARVKKQLGIYLIGGCAMSLRGLKESTKDIDIVFRNENDYEEFCNALFGAQFIEQTVISREHTALKATKMFENRDGMHLDLFVRHVLGKLRLSRTMVARAQMYKRHGKMTVFLLSPEDVFLFKSVASESRKRDLPDMLALYPSVDWTNAEKEIITQRLPTEFVDLVTRRLQEFSSTYSVDVPLLKKLAQENRT